MKHMALTSEDRLRGFIATPSGARIPAIVEFKRPAQRKQYSHVGQVPIPPAWLDEFEEYSRDFHFKAENGECFTQFNVLDAIGDLEDGEAKSGRLILLRDHAPLAAE